MQHSVLLVPELDGQVTAILEDENLFATAPTREEALARLRYRAERIARGEGERVTLDLPEPTEGGVVGLAGLFADDPDLPRLVSDAYAARDRARDDDS